MRLPRSRPAIALSIFLSFVFLQACGSSPPTRGTPAAPAKTTIVNKGSDTMVNLALAWAEAYQTRRPGLSLSVTGGGSGTGIAALINGTVDMANASRRIKPEEVAQARANGVEPVEFVVARDAIAIVIHTQNPVRQLTLDQIADIYAGRINNWSEVGGEDRPIVRLSRETNSGTHVYFLEEVLRHGDPDDETFFSADTLLLPSSEGITREIAYNHNAIGYDGLGYVTDDVRVVAVGDSPAGPFILPSAETVNRQEYLIARDLYMYTAGEPTGGLLEYLEWIMSEEGQAIVTELGFVPVVGGE
ncbi:MAG TPA: PstS family phosphate ABC transporter substrate-binding protein [Anaerolineales bacterium]|nr:PstS family phosphate ABC transporter substrate-binding protein [Anaerolineales bacterium]